MNSRRLIQLREWQPTQLNLSSSELAELQAAGADLRIQPLTPGEYLVEPSSTVGAVTTQHLRVLIEPKFSIDRLFYLLGRTRRIPFLRTSAELGEIPELTEGFIAVFLNMVRQRLKRGLLQGYVQVDEQRQGVRGRIRMADQLRRQFALPLPVEVTYDDYTEDIPENQLLKAALRRLEYLRPESTALRTRIHEALGAFASVSDREFRHATLPRFRYTRLTEPYRPILELAALVIENSAVELRQGKRSITGLLFDMNKVFEDFVFETMRRKLAPRLAPADRWVQGASTSLDEGGVLQPEPDLALWRRSRCLFVGDAKYKWTTGGRLDDLYQLLAYCSATDLDEGLLIYAEQPTGPTSHRVLHGGPLLRVESVDLESPEPAIERRLNELSYYVSRRASLA